MKLAGLVMGLLVASILPTQASALTQCRGNVLNIYAGDG